MTRQGTTEGRSRAAGRALAAALVLAGLAAIAVTAWRLRDAWVGDAAVYLPYARNAAEGHPFQFNVGEFSSGATGVLWSLLLAVPFLLGGGLGAAKALGGLFAAAGFLTALWAARRLSGSWLAAAVAALFALGTMPFYAAALYESGLVVGLAALALVAGERLVRRWREDGPRLRTLAPLVVVWAALPLARPDAAVLAGAQALAILLLGGGDRRRVLGLLAGGLVLAALPAALYFGVSLAELGTPSTSSQGRAFALQEVSERWIGPLYASGDAARALLGDPWVFGVVPGLAGLALALARRHWLGLYGLLAVLGYLALLTFVTPGLFDTPRYLLPIVPPLVAGIALLLAEAARRAAARPAALAAGAVAAALVLGLTAADELRDQTGYARRIGITTQEVFERDVVGRLDRLARPGEAVLAYEVQLRWFLRDDVAVLSEDGITDGRVAAYQKPPRITAFLRRYRPEWWIADRNVDVRPYLRGSVLQRARAALLVPGRPSVTLDGIRFTRVARRERPLAAGFGGWELLVRLRYGRWPAACSTTASDRSGPGHSSRSSSGPPDRTTARRTSAAISRSSSWPRTGTKSGTRSTGEAR